MLSVLSRKITHISAFLDAISLQTFRLLIISSYVEKNILQLSFFIFVCFRSPNLFILIVRHLY